MSLLGVEKGWERHETTSAGGPMMGSVPQSIFCLVIPWIQGTASGQGLSEPPYALIPQALTNSGIREHHSQSSSAALMELRRLSGLTWNQLARLLGVSRRSLHFWVSGKPLTQAHEERLYRRLATIRQLNRGSATANRALLLGARHEGIIPFDLLIEGQDDQVLSLFGRGAAPVRPTPSALSAAAHAARTPPPPDFFAGALHDRVHHDIGKARTPRVARSQQ